MRKTPRPAVLVLALVLVTAAVWWLLSGSRPPASTALLSASVTVTASAGRPPVSPRRPAPRAPVPLLSASADADAAALGAFEGRVISAGSGKGIADARIVLEHGGKATDVKTGADGAFRFAPPEAGSYALVFAHADGHLPFAPEGDASPITWTARPGARVTGFVLALEPATMFEIHVVSPTGDPVAGAEVRVLGPARDAAPGLAADARLSTDEGGVVRAPLPRDALVEARREGFAPGRARVTLSAEASHALTIRLRAKDDRTFGDAGSAISGRVVDADGEPVGGARVVATLSVANRAAATADLHPTGADTSDADGTFRIEGLDPGKYEVVASDGEHAPARAQDVSSGAEGVTLKLGAGGAIRGTVKTTAGSPVAAFSIVVSLVRGPLVRVPAVTRSFLDAEGRYEIEGLGPGDYEVAAAALDSAPSTPARATIGSPPGEPVNVDLVLSRGARLTGTVLDRATQKPIAGARVEGEGLLAASSDVPLVATAMSREDGTFELRGLGPGPRSLTVTAAGHHGRIVSGIVVGDTDPPPITVELTPVKPGEEPGIELVGIGAVLTPKDDVLLIGQALPGGGAAEVGLGPGDAIVAIDGVKVTELGFEGSITRIRGPEGSIVVLTVRKAGAAEVVDIPVPRRRIKG